MSKNIIITGTSRGIGFALAKQLADQDHQVLALSRNTKPIAELKHPNINSFPFDIYSEESLSKAQSFIAENWEKVDVLIHNADQFIKDEFTNITIEQLRSVYETNVYGVYRFTQLLMPYFKKDSHVLIVSSMGGIQGSVKFPGLTAYSSSKAA